MMAYGDIFELFLNLLKCSVFGIFVLEFLGSIEKTLSKLTTKPSRLYFFIEESSEPPSGDSHFGYVT